MKLTEKELEIVAFVEANDKVALKEIIARFVPSMRMLNRVFSGYFKGKLFRVDTQDPTLKKLIRKARILDDQDYDETSRVALFSISPMEYIQRVAKPAKVQKGSIVFCNDHEYGVGEVVQMYESQPYMLVKFQMRKLKTMCSADKMITIHDDQKRKLVLLR